MIWNNKCQRAVTLYCGITFNEQNSFKFKFLILLFRIFYTFIGIPFRVITMPLKYFNFL